MLALTIMADFHTISEYWAQVAWRVVYVLSRYPLCTSRPHLPFYKFHGRLWQGLFPRKVALRSSRRFGCSVHGFWRLACCAGGSCWLSKNSFLFECWVQCASDSVISKALTRSPDARCLRCLSPGVYRISSFSRVKESSDCFLA